MITKDMHTLMSHIDVCPLGWHEGKILRHKDTTDADVLAWLQKLVELNSKIKNASAILDVRFRMKKPLTRTL